MASAKMGLEPHAALTRALNNRGLFAANAHTYYPNSCGTRSPQYQNKRQSVENRQIVVSVSRQCSTHTRPQGLRNRRGLPKRTSRFVMEGMPLMNACV